MKRLVKQNVFIPLLLFSLITLSACGRFGRGGDLDGPQDNGPVLPPVSQQGREPGGFAAFPVRTEPHVAAPIPTPAPPHDMVAHRAVTYFPLTPIHFAAVEPFNGGFARVHTLLRAAEGRRTSHIPHPVAYFTQIHTTAGGARRYGFVNTDGIMVIPPVYTETGDFIDGVVWVRTPEGDTMLLDYNGEPFFLFPPGLSASNNARFMWRDRADVFGAYNTGGHIITRAVTDAGPLFGLMDTSGLEIIPPTFAWLGAFYGGRGVIQDAETRHWGAVDREGTPVFEPAFSQLFNFAYGVAVVEIWALGSRLNGAIDSYGELVIPIEFNVIYPFTDGLALVQRHSAGPFGFMNTVGEMVISEVFANARSFSEGLAAVAQRDVHGNWVWGFIDGTGNFIIEPQFYEVRNFSDGMATVALRNAADNVSWGFINTAGEIAVPPQYAWVGDFSEGLAAVNQGAEVYTPTVGSALLNWERDIGFEVYPIGGTFMLIDYWGRVVLDLSAYDAVRPVSEGILAVNQGRRISDSPTRRYFVNEGLWGFIRLVG